MKVPFHLRKLPAAEPASALLLMTSDVGALLALCARLGIDPSGRLFSVPRGFLILLEQPTTSVFPHTIRLRSLTPNLLLPVDAELVPTLLDDEARGLVRERGMVFLPGGQVLGFTRDRPLSLASLLTAGPLARQPWQPFPERRALAERIEEIALDLPHDSPDDILEAGGQAIGTDEPRPADASAPARAMGNVTLAAGKGLFWLGQALGLKGLAGLGAKWINSALEWAPRLSESVLGRQEAALRELLRQFRAGDLEKALRRALPLGEAGDRGSVAARDAQLPVHNLRYSLGNILGGGSGPASIWTGGADVQRELAREYRKAAEQAIRRGDFRRAAFIYGKLLRDYRLAASTLMQGGLHHDAAILYLDKLGDPLAAARAFEAAGEIDRAVQLYRQRGEHVQAGDLLRRAGEEEAALVEYELAAEKLLASGHEHLAAGDLILNKVGRAELALGYFKLGWNLRPQGNAVPCAMRMARLYAQQETPAQLLELLSEAEEFFRPAGSENPAGQFFNLVATLAEQKELATIRDDLRDRALLALAAKVRQHAGLESRPGTIVSTLLGESSHWSPALVSDAQFALKTALKRPALPPPPRQAESPPNAIPVIDGIVSAACYAPSTGDVFLGAQNGSVACFRPLQRETIRLQTDRPRTAASLATDATGDHVVVLHHSAGRPRYLVGFERSSTKSYRYLEARPMKSEGECWLTPLMARTNDTWLVGVWDGEELRLLGAAFLNSLLLAEWTYIEVPPALSSALLVPFNRSPQQPVLLVFQGDLLRLHSNGEQATMSLGWKPSIPPNSPLQSLPLAWWQSDAEHLEIAGLGETGTLYWSSLEVSAEPPELLSTNASAGDEGYLAAAILRSGFVAGVRKTGIDWLRCGTNRFSLWAREELPLPSAVACFPSPLTNELIVVLADGSVMPVTVPA